MRFLLENVSDPQDVAGYWADLGVPFTPGETPTIELASIEDLWAFYKKVNYPLIIRDSDTPTICIYDDWLE